MVLPQFETDGQKRPYIELLTKKNTDTLALPSNLARNSYLAPEELDSFIIIYGLLLPIATSALEDRRLEPHRIVRQISSSRDTYQKSLLEIGADPDKLRTSTLLPDLRNMADKVAVKETSPGTIEAALGPHKVTVTTSGQITISG